MALSTVGEWFGSAIISKLLDTASSYLGERMLPADTKSELRRVKVALPKIAAVMGVVEVLKFKHPNSGVNEWLEQFKEAFLAAEDVLDELKYRELEDKVKIRDQVSGSSSSIIDSLKRKFTGSNISEDTLKRLREALEMLDLVAAGVGDFFQFTTALDFHGLANPNNQPVYTSSRETTSLLTESKVVGRENEKAMIIEWLKKPASHGNISAFCIVGVGGLGKTTLAQLISEEISKEKHFDKTIWVCISTNFCVQDITRKILEDLDKETHIGESLNGLMKSLKEKILSKKVFLILDDVWNDHNKCDWEKLIAPLKFAQKGSKFLLTTRMKSVADMFTHVLNGERENLVLKGLEEQELLELLNKYAFYGYNPNYHKDLQKIGNDIVKKLRGSPLAAKVIGSLLNSNINFQYWKRILNHDSLINLEQAKDIADVLKLSYYHLPAYLQECFRFCCIFPQDYAFDKDELIKIWMASGFIRQELNGGARPEDIGEEYFNHLFRKSFFERDSKYENYYVIHDLMHDMAQNVSKGECCRVEQNDKSDFIPNTAQHVSVHESKIERIFNLKNLRTLVINLSVDDNNRVILPNSSLKETLRILVIHGGAGRIEIPEEIGSLIHLKFLKVDTRYVAQSFRYLIPNSICNLYHLQVLNISDGILNSDYESVKIGISNLVNLRYLDLPYQVMPNIHGLHKLTSLQKLYFFVGRESGCHIDVLEMLNNLRILSIEEIENVGDPVEATNANLFKKKNLISLFLNWEGRNSDNLEQVIDNLRPHPNLKELTIEHYAGHKSPIWMQDSDLSYLKLDNCPFWEAQPILGQIPHLKKLYLHKMEKVKEVDYSCNSTSDWAFPSLEEIYCSDMPKWESWTGPHNCYGFPNLKELEIECCPNLAKIPAIPFSLFRFVVNDVGLNSLPDMHHGSSIIALSPLCMKSSLRVVKITQCPKLKALNGFMQQENLDLHAIQELAITNCKNLLQFPTGRFEKLACLKYFIIENCPNLNKLPNIPLSLNGFTIKNIAVSNLPEYFQSSCSSGPTSSSLKASLRDVNICSCPNLTSLNGFMQQENIDLRDLEKLAIRDCKNLSQFPTGGFEKLPYLKYFIIENCPNLHKLTNIPLSLNCFTIKNVAVSDLPEYFQSSRSSGPTSSSLKASLKDVKICNCSNLTSLNGFLQQENLDLHSIQELAITDCTNLLHFPTGGFENLACLKYFIIENCPNLDKLPNIPLSLNYFTMKNMALSDLPEYFQSSRSSGPTSSSLKASLKDVKICSCSNITSLNGFIQQENIDLRDLEKLAITDCKNLSQFPTGGFEKLAFLKYFIIKNCPNLNKLPNIPLSLNHFTIKNVAMSDLPEYFQSSRSSGPTSSSLKASLTDVKICNCSNLTTLNRFLQQENLDLNYIQELAITNCTNLLHFPTGGFEKLACLKYFIIENCSNLNKLPNIPLSLNRFTIKNVAVSDLPEYFQSSRSSGPTSSSLKASLKDVKICSCSNLTSLNGFMQQENIDLRDLEKLAITDCKNLSQFPTRGFEKLACLKYFTIENCPNLNKLSNIPLSLNCFTIKNMAMSDLPEYFQSSRSSGSTSSSLKASLRDVKIYNCSNLTFLNGFLQQKNLDLHSIQELAITNCTNLLQFPTGGFEKLACLKYFIIKNCPNLNKLPNIPLSLNGFTIKNMAVSELPLYFQSSRSSGPTSSSLKASLKNVKICNCSNLTSLNGFLQQENIGLRGLEKLAIKYCKNLVQLPTGAFGNFVSLKHLLIMGSPKLVTIDNQSIFLPMKLEYLEIGNCGELDVPLLESASQLPTLTVLSVENSANITCIPSSENAFPSLIWLKIRGCNKLVELSSMQQAHTVNPRNTLVSLKISYLSIDHLCLLLIEPLSCLRFVSVLLVSHCSGMEALPEQWLLQNSDTLEELSIDDASSLRSLSSTMVMLTALEKLHIGGATLLKDIPELPS